MLAKNKISDLLKKSDIIINGHRDWDIQIHDNRFYQKVLSKGSIGMGESYMKGWWDSKQLDQTISQILYYKQDLNLKFNLPEIWLYFKAYLFNLQSKSKAENSVTKHYDLGNELYMQFLDPYNQYSCAYFKKTTDLDIAQELKLDLICRKLQLKQGDKVLDIGCGWGGFAKFAAERYKCEITGITLSNNQYEYAQSFCKELPIKILKQDYRDLSGSYDKVVSIGMIEHVGYKNYNNLFKKVHDILKPEGIFVLQTIGGNLPKKQIDPWINRYIFPNAMIPSISQLSAAYEKLFNMEDLHNMGPHYDLTLMSWFKNFHNNWSKIKVNYDDQFYRMWKYYLLTCAGAFRSRHLQLWQFIFTKNGFLDQFEAPR